MSTLEEKTMHPPYRLIKNKGAMMQTRQKMNVHVVKTKMFTKYDSRN